MQFKMLSIRFDKLSYLLIWKVITPVDNKKVHDLVTYQEWALLPQVASNNIKSSLPISSLFDSNPTKVAQEIVDK